MEGAVGENVISDAFQEKLLLVECYENHTVKKKRMTVTALLTYSTQQRTDTPLAGESITYSTHASNGSCFGTRVSAGDKVISDAF